MRRLRVHAYAVEPERTTKNPSLVFGGSVNVNKSIDKALQETVAQFNSRYPIAVDLRVDITTRTSLVRDSMLSFSFGASAEADTAAHYLALRLSGAMDRRSSPCLLVAAVWKDDSRRRLAMWTFPQEEAFQFRRGTNTPSMQLPTDIFSRTSRLRKGVLFEGGNRRTDFLRGSVLDFQASSVTREVADFWIVRFLGAVLAIHGPAGTRQLANCLRTAYEKAETPAEREQVYAATMGVRSSPKKRWSLDKFADQYLEGHTRDTFLEAAPNQETLDSTFDFDRAVFDNLLNFRIFELDTGVFVSSPLYEVGKSVKVSGDKEKHLRCEGIVVEDHLRKRHA